MPSFKTYAEYDSGVHESIVGDYMLVVDHEKIVNNLKAEIEALKADNTTLNNLNLELEEDVRYWMNREMYE